MILTCAAQDPAYIGFTIGLWIIIAELLIVLVIKFYQTYYQVTFAIKLCIFLIASIYILWIVIFSIGLLSENNHSLAFLSFFFGILGFAFLTMFIIAWL